MPEIGLFGSEGGAPTHGVPTLSIGGCPYGTPLQTFRNSIWLSTHVRNYGDVFRQAAGARRLTPMLARYVIVF